ncbi:MAG TPA: FUSC family protein [Trebonia sp.]
MAAAGPKPRNPWWKPIWSVPAALRAVRAAVVVPAVFAISYKLIGDAQMTLFATFGGFATLVIANFGGPRRVKLISHAGLAIAGSIVLIIGTAASGITWLAVVVTFPVVFAVFFAGSAGPNAAAGVTPVLFAYVLPIVSAGGPATIPSRLAGWWFASVVGTAAVLLLSPKTQGDRLRAAASALAAELSRRIGAAADGEFTPPDAMRAKARALRTAFTAAPYRPTGLATTDQALASVVQLLDWAATQTGDALDGHDSTTWACPEDRALLGVAAGVLGDVSTLLAGREATVDFGALEKARAASTAHLRDLPASADARLAAVQAVHAQTIAVAARNAAADALIAADRADPATVAVQRRTWFGVPADSTRLPPLLLTITRLAGLAAPPSPSSTRGDAKPSSRELIFRGEIRGATTRSVWFANSLRAATALAAAVLVADLSGVQHAFWVVLGTLSVLRTNAVATGATVWRALAGTVLGFAVGAGLLIGIGTAQAALWAAFPIAVLFAAYAPGTTPFTVGQAAFTVVIVVLFNLLAPAGWTVGLLRVEDVAIGCAVSLLVGVLAWPRGASGIVADDLADAFRTGAEYLVQAVDWALSELMTPPAATTTAVAAGLRLDDAVRGLLAEEGSKKASKEDLWALLAASQRLRLTANTLGGIRHAELIGPEGPVCMPLPGSEEYEGAAACTILRSAAVELATFYGRVADQVERPGPPPLTALDAPPEKGPLGPVPDDPVNGAPGLAASGADAAAVGGADAASAAAAVGAADNETHPHLLWIHVHLHHLAQNAQTVSEPALRVAEARGRPWWR